MIRLYVVLYLEARDVTKLLVGGKMRVTPSDRHT